MTLVLPERAVADLLSMSEVVSSVEECFRQESAGKNFNAPRSKIVAPGSVFSVMSASSPYLGRAGLKCYVSTRRGSKFYFLLFRLDDGAPLAMMGGDMLGRYRTGAASAVATKYLYPGTDIDFAILGAGRQAITQVLAMAEVKKLRRIAVWSRDSSKAKELCRRLGDEGLEAEAATSPSEALLSSDVGTSITSAKDPFIGERAVARLSHINLCGSNWPDHAELEPPAIARFRTIAVDGLEESKQESGDLIMAEKAGTFSWERAAELKDFVGGSLKPVGPTLFKSNGVAIEDVAVASLVYDKAAKGGEFASYELEI